jgi:hypothetical protein
LVERLEAAVEEYVRVLYAATGRLAVPADYKVPHLESLDVSLSPQVAAQDEALASSGQGNAPRVLCRPRRVDAIHQDVQVAGSRSSQCLQKHERDVT